MRFFTVLIFSAALLLTGCKSDQPETETTGIPAETAGRLRYTVPESWTAEEPKSRMRIAQFRLPGQDGAEDAELAVFVFPGTGGSVQANLERWYGQFKQPDGAASEDKADIEKISVNTLPVTIIYVTGTYLQSTGPMMGGPVKELPQSAMLAAIVETENDPWFFKAVGPQITIDKWRPSFNNLVQSFKWE